MTDEAPTINLPKNKKKKFCFLFVFDPRGSGGSSSSTRCFICKKKLVDPPIW